MKMFKTVAGVLIGSVLAFATMGTVPVFASLLEVDAARGQETQAPRGEETQAPRGQETQAPRGQETQAP